MTMLTRRQTLEAFGAVAVATVAPSSTAALSSEANQSVVYWTPELSKDAFLRMYHLINKEISGKVALKLHTGEPNGPNILPREWVKALQAEIPNSNIVECNVLYKSPRQTTAGHRKVIEQNGWTFCPVDFMDEEGDVALPVKDGLHLKEFHVGKHLLNYDSMVVLTHFKGHGMGGFGGSLKNISIGCGSAAHGKVELHNVQPDGSWPGKAPFMERMADGGKAILDHFGKKIVFINVLRNMSIDCDCAGVQASTPTLPDLGIMASTDLLAIDQACVDLIYSLPDFMKRTMVKRIESREALRQLSAMRELKMGNPNYKIVRVLDIKPGQRPLEDDIA